MVSLTAQQIGIEDGRFVVVPELSTIAPFVQYLAWPLAAILIVVLLRKNLLKVAEGAIAMKTFVDDGTKLASVLMQFKAMSDQISALQTSVASLRQGIENIEIQEIENISSSIEQQVSRSNVAAPKTAGDSSLSTEGMWLQISEAWDDIKISLRRRMQMLGVDGNFHGTSNISKIVSALADAKQERRIQDSDAELIMALAKQFSWMYRTTVPREEYLTADVYRDFLRGAETAKRILA